MPKCGGSPASDAYASETGIAYAASVIPAIKSSGNQEDWYRGSHSTGGNTAAIRPLGLGSGAAIMESVSDIRTLVCATVNGPHLAKSRCRSSAKACILPFILPYSSHGRSYVHVMKTPVVPVITPGLAWAVLRQTLSASANVDSAVQVSDSRS